MVGTVVRVTRAGVRVMSDGASTHHVRVRWSSGCESLVPNGRLVPACSA